MKRSAFTLILLLILYLTNQGWWYLSTPLGQSPDELDHVAYVCHMVDHGEIPRLTESASPSVLTTIRWQTARGDVYFPANNPLYTRGEESAREMNTSELSPDKQDEAGQPPLAYLLPAGIIATQNDGLSGLSRWHITRLCSIIFGSLAIVAGWYTGRQIWTVNPDLGGLILAGWMIAVPMAGALRSVASNDALAISIASWIFALMITWSAANLKRALTLGALLALGLLTKASLIALLPLVILWLLIADQDGITKRWRLVFITTIIPIVTMSVFYGYSQINGSWHYFDLNIVWMKYSNNCPDRTLLTASQEFAVCMLGWPESFFGLFGIARIHRGITSLTVSSILLLIPLVATTIWLIRQRKDTPAVLRKTIACLIVVGGIMLLGGVKEVLTISLSALSGRHFLILQLPIGILLIYGWSYLLSWFKISTEKLLFLSGTTIFAICLLSTWDSLFNVTQQTFLGLRAFLNQPDGIALSYFCGNLPLRLKWPNLWYWLYVTYASTITLIFGWTAYLWLADQLSKERSLIYALGASLVGLGLLISLGL